jgi:membrane fusion protein, heavy metal efflux system
LQQARSQLAFAQEKYDRDRDLLKAGAIPRRQVLESETQLMEVKAVAARAASRLDFLQAESQLQKAQSDVSLARSRIQLSQASYETRLKQLGASANPDGTIMIKAPRTAAGDYAVAILSDINGEKVNGRFSFKQ